MGHFCPPGSGPGFRIQIRIRNTAMFAMSNLRVHFITYNITEKTNFSVFCGIIKIYAFYEVE